MSNTATLAAQRTSRDSKKEQLAAVRAIYRAEVEALCRQLKEGAISVNAWSEAMQAAVKDVQIGAYLAGKSGDWESMTQSDWGRIGSTVRGQYDYLRRWAADLKPADVLAGVSVAGLVARAGLYAAAATQGFEQGYVSEVGLPPGALPAYPGDGSTECRTNCKCRWAITVVSKRRGDYRATWRLGSAEHCRTCRQRARAWKQLEIRGGVLVSGYEPIYAN